MPVLSFASEYLIAKETAGQVNVQLTLSKAIGYPVSVDVRLAEVGTATSGIHMDFTSNKMEIPAQATSVDIEIPVHAVASSQADAYFALLLENAGNATIGPISQHIVYLQKKAIQAPVAANNLKMEWLGSYSVTGGGTAEIVAFHPGKKRFYVLNSTKSRVDILDASKPEALVEVAKLEMSKYGEGATSVAVQGDNVVATIDAGPEVKGKVVFMDLDGNERKVLEVGNLPDMVTFSPDGKWVLTANEGQPKSDYTVDAEGSVSMIDISAGIANLTQANVHTVDFLDFNSKRDELIAQGVRLFGVYNGGLSSVAQDLEPEYITISDDSKTAWVTLQENNAIAVLDLVEKQVSKIHPLGFKDHSLAGNELDASDKTSAPLFVNWPVFGLYMPDAIAQYTVNGQVYVVTANEGDAREYSALVEEMKMSEVQLDASVFPDNSILKSPLAMGNLVLVGCNGLIDGVQNKVCAMGGRSFSIRNATTGALVYDSGSDLERITAADPAYGHLFNANNDKAKNNVMKNRSDNKGPEPEGIALGKIGDKTYAFISLERTGGVVAYDVSLPAQPVFESYVNSRNASAYGGDQGPEGIAFISARQSPTGRALVVTANELSGTIAVFGLNDTYTPPAEPGSETNVAVSRLAHAIEWQIQDHVVYFSSPTAVSILNSRGALLEQRSQTAWISLKHLAPGTYMLRLASGQALMVRR